MGVHAILGASSSKRWMTCPGSVKATSTIPSGPSSKYAEQGTAAHTLGEWCLEQDVDPKHFQGEVITTDEGSKFVVDSDMIEAVRVYYQTVKMEALKQGLKISEIQLEARFNLEWLHKGMFGTNDASFSVPFGDLFIYDYKHGAGIAVDAIDNTQMVYYAVGASYDLERKEWHDFEKIHMTIVQPRAFHPDGEVRTWSITMDELKEWAKKLKVAAIATEAKDAPLVPSDDGCRWCNASANCPAIHKRAMEIARVDFSPIVPENHVEIVDQMTLKECVQVVNHKNLLKSFVSGCEWRLEQSILREGKTVEGMKVVRGRGSRDWVDANDAQRILSQNHSMGEIMEMKIKTPAKLEKIVGKKVVQDLIYKREGLLKVAPSWDKRKEVKLENANELFTNVNN